MQAEDKDSMLKKNLDLMIDELAVNGYSISDQVFSQELCLELRKDILTLQEGQEFEKASIGHQNSKQIRSEIRGDFIFWLDQAPSKLIGARTPGEASQKALHLLEEIRTTLNQQLFLGLQRFEAHFAHYPPNAGYHKHWDNHRGLNHRRITFVLYLNDWREENGGELAVFSPDNENELMFKVAPQMGRLIVFRSEVFPHQVLESFADRYSLTGWFRTDL